jgi:hypothetical protein
VPAVLRESSENVGNESRIDTLVLGFHLNLPWCARRHSCPKKS